MIERRVVLHGKATPSRENTLKPLKITWQPTAATGEGPRLERPVDRLPQAVTCMRSIKSWQSPGCTGPKDVVVASALSTGMTTV